MTGVRTLQPTRLDHGAVSRVVHGALAEDVGDGDVTTNALFPPRPGAGLDSW